MGVHLLRIRCIVSVVGILVSWVRLVIERSSEEKDPGFRGEDQVVLPVVGHLESKLSPLHFCKESTLWEHSVHFLIEMDMSVLIRVIFVLCTVGGNRRKIGHEFT